MHQIVVDFLRKIPQIDEEQAKAIAQKLACTVVNACWLLNPAAIIIGGGVAKAGELLFNPLKESIQKQLAPAFLNGLEIIPAQFSNDAGIIGAAALALEEASTIK